VKFSINDTISVKLTDYGKVILHDYRKACAEGFGKIKIKPDRITVSQIETEMKKEYHEFKIWEFMSIFGKYCFIGGNNLCESDIIELKET